MSTMLGGAARSSPLTRVERSNRYGSFETFLRSEARERRQRCLGSAQRTDGPHRRARARHRGSRNGSRPWVRSKSETSDDTTTCVQRILLAGMSRRRPARQRNYRAEVVAPPRFSSLTPSSSEGAAFSAPTMNEIVSLPSPARFTNRVVCTHSSWVRWLPSSGRVTRR